MKPFLLFLIPGLLTILIGIAAWRTDHPILIETYKFLLGFTLVSVIGVAVKSVVDSRLDAEKESRRRYDEAEKEKSRRYEEWEGVRGAIMTEFTDIFSQFYSIRKLYHSALGSKNILYDKSSPQYTDLLRSCLQRATDLEGRYGALKMLIIRHFSLPIEGLVYDDINILLQKKSNAVNEKDQLRFALDILGEAYDDWRHALEQGRKIDVSESWSAYTEVLGFLDKQTWQPANIKGFARTS